MTSHELARFLLEAEDLPIVIPGYEGGYKEVKTVTCQPLHLNVHTESYYGPHDKPSHAFEDEPCKCEVVHAIFIS